MHKYTAKLSLLLLIILEASIYDEGVLSEGVLSGRILCLDGVMYGGDFVRGGFVRKGFCPEGVLSYLPGKQCEHLHVKPSSCFLMKWYRNKKFARCQIQSLNQI